MNGDLRQAKLKLLIGEGVQRNLFRNSAQAFVTSAAVSGILPSFDFGEAGCRKLVGLAISSEPYLLKTPPWRLGG